MQKSVVVNGLGRIGRGIVREILKKENFRLIALNDIYDIDHLVYLLKYDSVHKSSLKVYKKDNETIFINGKEVKYYSSKDLSFLKNIKANLLIECSGVYDKASYFYPFLDKNIDRVLFAFVIKDNTPMFVFEVNHQNYLGEKILSAASCTSTCVTPILKILNDFISIKRVFATTIHSYNADQNLLDSKTDSLDFRKARSSTLNLLPISSGIAYATSRILPFLKGKILGCSVRVPVCDVTAIDLSLEFEQSVDKFNLIEYLKKQTKNSKRILLLNTPFVSSDIISSPYSSIIDLSSIEIIDNFLKIFIWQDNEIGYINALLDTASFILEK